MTDAQTGAGHTPLYDDLLKLFEKLDQFDWLLNPDHMKAVADEIDCDTTGCREVWHEYDTNASGCRLSESGGYCPNELAVMLRDAALVAQRLNERRDSFGRLPPAINSHAEMLAALKGLIDAWELGMIQKRPGNEYDEHEIKVARTAIAKAERTVMSEGTFTEGPWFIGGENGDGEPTIVYCDNELGSAVADCGLPFSIFSKAEREANARLIAAAPDMYAALKAWVAMARDAIDQYGVDPHPTELARLEQAEAALSKARG